MKNVLFTTTAVAALAFGGTAFAAGHGNFGISGSTDVGYNDDIEGGIFQETNIDFKASKDAGNGVTVGGHARLNLDWYEGSGESTNVEFKNVFAETGVGKLEYADSFDGTGASDSFYKDRDGMVEDMSNGDGHAGLKWSGDYGNFGYAIDMGNLANDSSNNASDEWTIGVGGDFGPATVGLGYENNQHDDAVGGNIIGVSADFDAGIADVGLSYITSDVADSIGIAASAEISPGMSVGAYYAINSDNTGATPINDEDRFGVTFDYANGPFGIAIDYDTGDNGADGSGDDRIEVDVSYDMGNGVVAYAGWDSLDLNDSGNQGAFYVGAEIEIADGVSATIAYAEADEIGGPEFKDGTSAYLSLTY